MREHPDRRGIAGFEGRGFPGTVCGKPDTVHQGMMLWSRIKDNMAGYGSSILWGISRMILVFSSHQDPGKVRQQKYSPPGRLFFEMIPAMDLLALPLAVRTL